jgi:signal transduction histidine kinase
MKDEFLASMSHELRTPLNTILGVAEVLQEQIYGPLTAKQYYALGNLVESGRHLLSLINDILDLAKVEAGQVSLNLEQVEVEPVCEAAVRMIRQTATARRLTVTMRIDPAVKIIYADELRLKQVLINLLTNAVKFTPAGGNVGLEVEGDPDRQRVRFAVWDTGIGIAEDDLGQLFQPFVQLDSRLSRAYEGTGLGLALVARLTALHHGEVMVTSKLGQGSRFTVTLPW